ncbi:MULTISPECIES: DUF2325 domain-containing protein [unclassified Candidatus Frackibacter]|uniref:DUF2325 domain-containing protein n=1 Tax=unclassified Candidatus Frackibacter TaxID=2648818 RepID=UPI000799ADB4|nr:MULTISPECIES: DUF2325 domain-containing protein [unclassified Candidatus Frackibacter]KXS45981.1 MAG: hypothetical protein AWU54_38 [Candidatus Frackibacter sp. T328-2]SDC03870.1 hypothetical protein SAMN04515661_101393 [Candidatus Frackibacter sp. WG11]SEM68566.1 hypothetical protein SAMN04488698_11217 [Candidatus Frackibacter sp. WG12]SFL79859.1 hypothetical protein SAMN04488699_11417 [Candidatus Frackibacter sp. WG13]
MSILVVGGDRLGKIPNKLDSVGFDKIMHISGRKKSQVNWKLPLQTDLVLVLTDYVSHNLSDAMKAKAKSKDIPILFSRRAWSSIYKTLDFTGFLK